MRASGLKLVCISDTHGDHKNVSLPPGDVLIHAGDLTGHGTKEETFAFSRWFGMQNYNHKICVAGNHDTYIEQEPLASQQMANEEGVVLLNDTGCNVEGVSIWGSPITPRFLDWSFMRDPGKDIEAHWDLIPVDTDILITHGPAYGVLDELDRESGEKEHTGCPSLLKRIEVVQPIFHVFGHIHEDFGRVEHGIVSHCNVSTMNKQYEISNKAVELLWPKQPLS
jgi:Icc-related predicted phosphoesterase